MTTLLFSLIIACGAWAAAAAVLIAQDLEKHGIVVDYLWWRMRMPRYVAKYRQYTLAETGRVGSLFYHFAIHLNIALVLVVLLLVRQVWP